MHLDQLLDEYAPLRGISGRTEQLYRFTLNSYSKFLGRRPTIDDLEELNIAKFLSWRLSERSAATAAKDRAQLHALWTFAAQRGHTTKFPTIRRVKIPKRVPEAWTVDQMRKILESCSRMKGCVSATPASEWWVALVHVAYETAERISAILALEWDEVGEEGVIFLGDNRKGAGAPDIYRKLTPETMKLLRAVRGETGLVFKWDRNRTYLWGVLGKILKDAGLPSGRRSKFHRFRKTCASHAAAAGVNPQKLLDHSSPRVTELYLDPRITGEIQASDVLPSLSSRKLDNSDLSSVTKIKPHGEETS